MSHLKLQRARFNAAPLVRKRTAVARLKRAKSAISIGDLKYKRCLVLAIDFHVVISHPCAPFTPFPSSRSTQGSTTAPSPRFIPQSLAAMKTHCTSDTKGFRVCFFFPFFCQCCYFYVIAALKVCTVVCVCVRACSEPRGPGLPWIRPREPLLSSAAISPPPQCETPPQHNCNRAAVRFLVDGLLSTA